MFDANGVTPTRYGSFLSVMPAAKPRKRKPWEFSWDGESPPVASGTAKATAGFARGGVAEGRRRARKPWEFKWDDDPVSAPAERVGDIVVRQPEPQPIPVPSVATGETSTSEASGEAKPRRRPRRAARVRTEGGDGAHALAPDMIESAVTAPCETKAASEPVEESGSTFVEPEDVERARRGLLALGRDHEPGHDASVRHGRDDVLRVRTRRGRREVQVVHHPARATHEPGAHVESEILPSRDPLIANALKLVTLLSRESEDVAALRRAVREMRDAVAGVEAKVFAKPSREIPLFRQAYDPKTRTG